MDFAGVGLRRIGLTAAVLVAAAIVPASASAALQTIPGSGFGPSGHNLTIYIDDHGKLQAKAGAPADSVDGMFYGSDTSSASNYWHLRLKGAPAADTTFTSGDAAVVPVSNGPVTGNFTPSSPAQNVTVMNIVSGGEALFQIRQTTLYTSFSQRFRVVWEITNTDPQNRTLPFIFGTSADLYIDGSDSGVGVFIDGPSRFVGGTNSTSRTTGGLQEVTSSSLPGEATPTVIPNWGSYQESGYTDATNRLKSNDSYLNTIQPNSVDNGVGVSFNNLATNGLAPGQTQRYEVMWHNKRPTPLSASPAAASAEVPGQHQVTLTLVDANFNPVPGQRIDYEFAPSSVNPLPAGSATTNGSGQVVVSWNGTNVGLDTLTAWADTDGSPGRTAEDPAASATMRWLADNHVDGPPTVPQSLTGPNGQVPVQVQQNPDNAEAPSYIFGRSATSAAGFTDCTFDQRSGRDLNLPVSVTLQPGAGTISNVSLALIDPARHNPTDVNAPLPTVDSTPSVSGNTYGFEVPCVVNGQMWVTFTLTENAVNQIFRIPIGGLALIDPQGVVYDGATYDAAIAAGQAPADARATAAISGATVRLQRLVAGDFVNVLSGDPGITPNINPQTTGTNGIYQWDVQAGTYRVTVTKQGCTDTTSPSVDIPPPALDLHVRMDCGAVQPPVTEPDQPVIPGPGPAADTKAPATKLGKGPKAKSTKTTAKFTFSADENATFECKLTGKKTKKSLRKYSACTSPKTYKKLKPGKYTFAVLATDAAGNTDSSAETAKFKVIPKP